MELVEFLRAEATLIVVATLLFGVFLIISGRRSSRQFAERHDAMIREIQARTGCTCSTPLRGDWWLDPNCVKHGHPQRT